MAADETRPAGINNEPGVATAECAEPTVDTSHTADQTLQCCSQPLLQITRETPYSHYPEHTAAHYCRESGEYTGDCHSGDNWHLSWDVRRLLYFISVTKLSPENWWHLPYLLTSPPVTVYCYIISLIISPLLLSSTCHSESMQLQNWVTRWQKVINQSKPRPQF